jgi:hypothetical protein
MKTPKSSWYRILHGYFSFLCRLWPLPCSQILHRYYYKRGRTGEFRRGIQISLANLFSLPGKELKINGGLKDYPGKCKYLDAIYQDTK